MFGSWARGAVGGGSPWEVAGATHPGRVRPVNEDAWRISPGLWVVADGMGGHRGGAEASRRAVDAVVDGFARTSGPVAARLVRAIEAANEAVWRMSSTDPELAGMGCTLVAAAPGADTLHFMHVGDARGYVAGPDGLEAVTRDHSYVGDLVARGELTPEKAATHPRRNVVTRAVGVEPEVEVEHTAVPLTAVGGVLLCSDGLWGVVAGPEVARLFRSAPGSAAACRCLVSAALSAGAPDNVTAVVARRVVTRRS